MSLKTTVTHVVKVDASRTKSVPKVHEERKSAGPALNKINKDATKIQKSVPGVSRQDAVKIASKAYIKNKK